MSRRSLLNLALLTLLIGLGLLAFFEPGKTPPPEPPRLLTLDAGALTRVRIEQPGKPPIELKREDGAWRLLAPIAIAANPRRLELLLKLTEEHIRNTLPPEADPARYGLAPPRVRLWLDETELQFGDTSALDQRRYVRLDGRIHLIRDVAYYHLVGGFATFVDLHPLPPDSRLEALTLPGLELRREAGRWQAAPQPPGWSADAANHLAQAWERRQALQVKPYTGNGEGERLSLTLAGHEAPLDFLIVQRTPELVLARPELGIAYHLGDGAAAELLQLPAPAEGPASE